MKVTLIITTYNWTEALNVTLKSALLQSILPDEIIVADDGSKQETIDFVKTWQEKSKIPIIHSWQEDKGFRLATSRNKAIAKSKYEYIILVDGDLFLHKSFIEGHIRHAKENQFCVGTRVIMGDESSKQIIKEPQFGLQITLFSKGILKNAKNAVCSNLLSKMISYHTTSHKKVRGANMAFWKTDLLRVNGFNEDFVGWGREDTEIVVRLLNAGIKRKNIKFNANVLHLYHQECSREMLSENDDILKTAIDKKQKVCANGLDKHL